MAGLRLRQRQIGAPVKTPVRHTDA